MVPFFAVVITGVISRRGTAAGAIGGALSGALMGALINLAYLTHRLHFGSELSANFYAAIVSFVTSLAVCLACDRLNPARRPSEHMGLPGFAKTSIVRAPKTLYVLATLLLVCCVVFNIFWS